VQDVSDLTQRLIDVWAEVASVSLTSGADVCEPAFETEKGHLIVTKTSQNVGKS